MQLSLVQTEVSASPGSSDAQQLLDQGYLIIENAIQPETLRAVNDDLAPHFAAAPFGTGAFFGPETKRFGGALARSATLGDLVLDERIFGIVDEVLSPNCDCLQLSLTQGIEIHPGAPAQGPHRDADMWWLPRGMMECMVNVMWALDDFAADNGSTRVWPQSNRTFLDQPLLPDDMALPLVMPRGSACLFLGSTMHSGGANFSAAPRRGLLVSYCLGWLKPWENQWLAYPPEVARTFHPELAALVGYRQHRPSLGNIEGRCPSALLGNTPVAAAANGQIWIDTLLPEQSALADEYRAFQLSAAACA